GEICVGLRLGMNDQFVLTVSDNGIGLPKGTRMQGCETLGLKLVSVLVKQIKGAIHLGERDGAEFVITFEAKKQVQRSRI
ncbi:MAG: hypothetical protein PHS17_13100, partial [Desulfobacterales bacterium]|nr:hypothetical protein [Desulfobacterales bacterium]